MVNNGQSIWLEINLATIRRNIKRIEIHTGRPVMAVVKANGYGHGILEVARAATQAGSVYLCVARIEEALRIRSSGLKAPILVMGYTKPDKVNEAIKEGITLTVADFATASAYGTAAKADRNPLIVHAKIDSGMSRLGVLAEQGADLCGQLQDHPHLDLEGIFTHFACADELKNPATMDQIRRFDQLLEKLDRKNARPRMVHAANSAASIFFPDSWYDAVRPGIAIYGLNPAPDAPLPNGFEKALTWKCLLSSVKVLPKGSGVGYGHQYFTSQSERIGVAAAGYADGLRRWKGNTALLRGKQIEQAGGICMDQSMWHLDGVPDAQVGDEVVLIGRQGEMGITAEQIAAGWGTIDYEVVCGLTDRVHRIFIDDEEKKG